MNLEQFYFATCSEINKSVRSIDKLVFAFSEMVNVQIDLAALGHMSIKPIRHEIERLPEHK